MGKMLPIRLRTPTAKEAAFDPCAAATVSAQKEVPESSGPDDSVVRGRVTERRRRARGGQQQRRPQLHHLEAVQFRHIDMLRYGMWGMLRHNPEGWLHNASPSIKLSALLRRGGLISGKPGRRRVHPRREGGDRDPSHPGPPHGHEL